MNDVPTAPEPRRPVALTVGGSGKIVAGIKRHLREVFDLRCANEGDDIAEAMIDVSAIVILEAASLTPQPSRYEQAMKTLREGLRSAHLPTLVTVTCVPPVCDSRKRIRRGLEHAEGLLRDQGVDLIVLRCSSVIGTPGVPGPSDPFVISHGGGRLRVRGEGKQRWTPLRIDDLGRIVTAAAQRGEGDCTYELGGPETTTVVELIRSINGQAVGVRELGPIRWWLSAAEEHLPDADLVVEGATDAAQAFGVPLGTVKSAWTSGDVRREQSRDLTFGEEFPYRIRHSASHACYLLGLLVLMCTVVGIVDLFGPAELTVRVTAVLLLLASAVMLVGVLALILPLGSRDLLAFLATVVSAFVLLLIFLTNRSQAASPIFVAILAAIGMFVAVWFAVGLWNAGGLEFGKVFGRGLPLTFTSVIGVGTIVGLGQFWYQNIYLPSVAHPAVNLSEQVEMGKGFARHRRVVYATLTMTNPTEREVTIVATHFEVLGRRLEKRSTGELPGDAMLLGRDRPVGRQVRSGDRTVLRSGEIVPGAYFLVPGEETTRRIAISVPRRHRVIEVNGYAIVARDRLTQEQVTPEVTNVHPDTRSIHRSFDVVEDSAWRKLTRGDRELYTMETLGAGSVGYGCPGFPQVQAYIEHFGKHPITLPENQCTEDAFDLADSYSMTQTSASTELVLPRVDP